MDLGTGLRQRRPPLLEEAGECLHVEVDPPVGRLHGAGGECLDHLVHAQAGAAEDDLGQLLDEGVLLDVPLLELLDLALEVADDEAGAGGHLGGGLLGALVLQLVHSPAQQTYLRHLDTPTLAIRHDIRH